MKKFIVYFPFPLTSTESGSGVRPIKLLEAFRTFAKQENYECIEITGPSNERKKALKRLYKEVDPKDILFCYMENKTIPIWLTDPNHMPVHPFMDYAFFRYLQRNDIPLGVFYRDIYWKFDHLYSVNNPVIKKAMLRLFKLELYLFKKYAKTIFLPSLYMNAYVKVDPSKVSESPPGGIDLTAVTKHTKDEIITAIYVGGISPRYGIYETLEAFYQLNKENVKIKLKLVCREKEYITYKEKFSKYQDCSWLDIIHAHGEELIPIYKQADFGIVTLQHDVYNDFAVPVKLFEYLSFGLPVLSSKTSALSHFVEREEIGIAVDDHVEAIQKGLTSFIDRQIRDQYKKNAINALKTKHLWIHRVNNIYKILVNP